MKMTNLEKEFFFRGLLDNKPLCHLLIFVGIDLGLFDIMKQEVLNNSLESIAFYITTLTKQLRPRRKYDYY